MIKIINAFYAGLFAACGSFFGKLTGDFFPEISIVQQNEILYKNIYIIQLICFCLMIYCNILNWRYFLKALHSTEQTLEATILSAAANYIFSFLFGIVIFQEKISSLSIVGISLILIGLCFLCFKNLSSTTFKTKCKKH